MSRMRIVRQQAPVLLEAAKEALRHLLRQDPYPMAVEEEKRQAVMAVLRKAIDAADPPTFDERETSIRLVMTPATWHALDKILETRASLNKDDKLVYDAVHEEVRKTKQRIYVTLAINHLILRRLCFVLKHAPPADQDRSFKRLAEEIEKDGLTKNPMEILAQMGL